MPIKDRQCDVKGCSDEFKTVFNDERPGQPVFQYRVCELHKIVLHEWPWHPEGRQIILDVDAAPDVIKWHVVNSGGDVQTVTLWVRGTDGERAIVFRISHKQLFELGRWGRDLPEK